MDHHDLDKSQKFLSSYVNGIVDHHDDMNPPFDYIKSYPNLKGDNNDIDRSRLKVEFPRCSNMALVLELAFKCEITTKFFSQFLNNDNFYDFLIGVLVVDTENFSSKTKDLKWVEKDHEVAVKILESCRRSIFFSVENGEDKLSLEKENEFHFNTMKTYLIDVKFDKDKNIALGMKALFNKDRKDFAIVNKHREHPVYVSYHSVPVSIFDVLKKEGSESLRKFFYDEAEISGLHMMVVLCREGKLSVAAHYLKKSEFFNEKNLEEYFGKVKENICKNDAVISKEEFLFTIKSKESINRKNLLPFMENFFKDIDI